MHYAPPAFVDRGLYLAYSMPAVFKTKAGAELNALRLLMQIAGDSLTKVADENWSAAAQSRGELPPFNEALVEEVYKRELAGNSKVPAKLKRIMLLEISQYLENYLWPHFDAETSSDAHILSILVSKPIPFLRDSCLPIIQRTP